MMENESDETENRYAIDERLSVENGKGGREFRWYECRQVSATCAKDAYQKAFPPDGNPPHNFRLRML
jgi:hypothetical protein